MDGDSDRRDKDSDRRSKDGKRSKEIKIEAFWDKDREKKGAHGFGSTFY